MILHQQLPFSIAVGIFLIHIWTQDWLESVAMVTRYAVAGGHAIFGQNCFSPFLGK